jgi:adenylate kinase
MMIVAVTGVGGVGKTTVTKILQKKLQWMIVRPDELAKKKNLYLGYDKERKSWVVDLPKLKKEVKKIAKKENNLIIESLYSHFFDADMVAVLRCEPKVLEKRLRKKYSWQTKIVENKEAEMIGIITQEAVEKHGRKKVFEFDTTRVSPAQTAKQIMQVLKGSRSRYKLKYRVGRIDWLAKV